VLATIMLESQRRMGFLMSGQLFKRIHLNCQALFNSLSFQPFSRYGRRSDGGSATECLEFRVDDATRFVDFELEFHNIAARWGANKASSHSIFLFVETSNVPGIFIVVNNVFVVHPSKGNARLLELRFLRK
jgi:hypothetical protein